MFWDRIKTTRRRLSSQSASCCTNLIPFSPFEWKLYDTKTLVPYNWQSELHKKGHCLISVFICLWPELNRIGCRSLFIAWVCLSETPKRDLLIFFLSCDQKRLCSLLSLPGHDSSHMCYSDTYWSDVASTPWSPFIYQDTGLLFPWRHSSARICPSVKMHCLDFSSPYTLFFTAESKYSNFARCLK